MCQVVRSTRPCNHQGCPLASIMPCSHIVISNAVTPSATFPSDFDNTTSFAYHLPAPNILPVPPRSRARPSEMVRLDSVDANENYLVSLPELQHISAEREAENGPKKSSRRNWKIWRLRPSSWIRGTATTGKKSKWEILSEADVAPRSESPSPSPGGGGSSRVERIGVLSAKTWERWIKAQADYVHCPYGAHY